MISQKGYAMRNLAVIPARGGSTRLKDKNITPLKGKPLIRWVTEAVIESDVFDHVLISTDSDEIFDAVEDLPVFRHKRPETHATVTATALNAMLDIIDGWGLYFNNQDQYETFSYFLPTCPFISADDIIAGMKLLKEWPEATVVSMTQIPETIQLACLMKDDWVLPVFDNLECGLTNSKFIKKYYKPSGAFYMGRTAKIKKDRNFFAGDVKGIILPPERSVDINTAQDLTYAESIL